MDWDEYFSNIAHAVAQKSKDPSSKFGCVIVRPDHTIASVGYNGFPRGVKDSQERYDDRATKYKLVVHAEANAILSALRNGVILNDCVLHISTYPCSSCCKLIIQSGVSEIVLDGDSALYNDNGFNERWAEEIETTKMMCQESGIKIRVYKRAK